MVIILKSSRPRRLPSKGLLYLCMKFSVRAAAVAARKKGVTSRVPRPPHYPRLRFAATRTPAFSALMLSWQAPQHSLACMPAVRNGKRSTLFPCVLSATHCPMQGRMHSDVASQSAFIDYRGTSLAGGLGWGCDYNDLPVCFGKKTLCTPRTLPPFCPRAPACPRAALANSRPIRLGRW